jgi:hypothetical protein
MLRITISKMQRGHHGRQAPFSADPVDAVVIALIRDMNHDPFYPVEKEIVPAP